VLHEIYQQQLADLEKLRKEMHRLFCLMRILGSMVSQRAIFEYSEYAPSLIDWFSLVCFHEA